MDNKRYKIVYITPSLYIAGGVERVLTIKANYFADNYDYDITIILTDGNNKPFFYPLSNKINVINLDIGFEELWDYSFFKKIPIYLKKQRIFKKKLTSELMRIRPDITVSLLRREINFINDIPDGSKKIGELHVNRANYRNFETIDTNYIKRIFEKYWMRNLVKHLKKLDRFIVLSHEDRASWAELSDVRVIPDPLSFVPQTVSPLTTKRVIAVGRYTYQKGFDLLLKAWAKIEKNCPDWELSIFGSGDCSPYLNMVSELGIDNNRCHLNGSTSQIEEEYLKSSLFVFSSRFEGFGMVLVEAMACGLPLVSFACPCGPSDIVSNGVDGFLVKNGAIDELAAKMQQIMRDENLRIAMGRNAFQNAQRYDINVIANEWKLLFDGLWS